MPPLRYTGCLIRQRFRRSCYTVARRRTSQNWRWGAQGLPYSCGAPHEREDAPETGRHLGRPKGSEGVAGGCTAHDQKLYQCAAPDRCQFHYLTRPIFDICREQRGGKEPCPTSFDGIRLLIWNWPYCPVMITEIYQSMRRMETDTAGQAEGTGMRCLTPPRANVNFEDSN